MAKVIGREREKETLRKTLESGEAELVAVYGRRRVGKTFLVREFYRDLIRVELTGAHGAALGEQLGNFAFALQQALGSGIRPATPASWQEAFQQLAVFIETLDPEQKHVIFLDELPWLATARSRFLSALEHFWNAWASRYPNLVVVVCGSSASWMIRNIIHHRGGLHNRITRRIRLLPFTLGETDRYLRSRGVELGHRQVIELYMALGGIPHYLKEVSPGRSAAQSINDLCCIETGPLADEFDRLYASLFKHSERHVRVIRALARKRQGLPRNEVLRAARQRTGGRTTDLLEELVASGFLLRTLPYGKGQKDALYRLADEFSLFHLSWIERRRAGQGASWLSKASGPAWKAWSGYAFEGVCIKHVKQLKRALGIEAVDTTEASWLYRPGDASETGAQVDLLIDRRDDCINLCEMKFSESEFAIDKAYAGRLRQRVDTFRRVTGTRKTVFLTMVTTHGVKRNAYRDELLANTIEADALFT